MALLMGATMAVIMLGFMWSMYRKRALNIAIFVVAAGVFALTLWLVRSQATVNELDYMRAMIPHHSIAVMTSERAQIDDPRVRKLADEIIAAQRREIAEMKYLIAQLDGGAGEIDALHEPTVAPRIVPPREAITSADIAKTDLGELDAAEIERVLGRRAYCAFHYSRAAGPVAAFTPAGGVIKLHGRLVPLDSAIDPKQDPANAVVLTADGVKLRIHPHADASAKDLDGLTVHEADAVLTLAAGLDVGYRGYYGCALRADAASAAR
jgi:hypothetical protein